MKNYLLAAAAATTIATPAIAKDGSIYAGIDGGITRPKNLHGGTSVEIIQTFNPADITPIGRLDPLGFLPQQTFDEGFDPRLKRGYDLDAILGYDFGVFRLEGELGYKKARRKGFDAGDTVLGYLNLPLNRPAIGFAPQPGTLPGVSDGDFAKFDGRVTFRTAMINGLVDLGNEKGLSFYAGGGFGRAWGAALNDRDQAFAYQLIVGARYPLSRDIDVGLKYRHFRTGDLNFEGGAFGIPGNDRTLPGRRLPNIEIVDVTLSRTAEMLPQFGGEYKSHSLLASLTYNFGHAEPPPPPPLPLPSIPPTSPQAMQTCPDGMMIMTTESCPLPSPPLPSPAPERG